MVGFTVRTAAKALFRNHVYTIRRGMAKGLKARGGGLFLPGSLTPEERFLLQLDLNGQNIYDIGGNSGIATLFFARACGASGQVITFEPNPECYQVILDNVALNGFGNVKVLQMAVGDQIGTAELVVPIRTTGEGTLDAQIGSALKRIERTNIFTVRVDSIDNMITPSGLPRPNFVKIDVEGLEFHVLLGMRETIARLRPRLSIEVHGEDKTQKLANAERIVRFLHECSYTIRHVESNGIITPVATSFADSGHLDCYYASAV